MISFDKYLKEKLKDKEFNRLFKEEKRLLWLSITLLEERQRRGLSQSELARKSNITQQQLSKLERGLNCNMTTFLKVCHALNIKFELRGV